MKHRFLYIMALLLTAATGAWAQDPDPIDLTPSADGTVWTLSTMPEYDVELEVTYYTDAELDQMAADEVIAKITAIGTVTYTPESKALIDAARTAYDALTAAQQALVTNYSTLTDAETTYATAKEAAFTAGVELTKASNGEWTLAEMPGFDIELEIEYETDLALNETTDNGATLDEWDGYEADVTLTRTLSAGSYNTFAAPFSTAIPEGWTVKELTSAELENDVLTLNFADATVIEAGKPYLVKVAENVENPTTAGVIVSDALLPTETDVVDFIPTLSRTQVTDDVDMVLFLSSDNKLKKPTESPAEINGFHAYFRLKGDGTQAKSYHLNLGEGTGIIGIENGKLTIDNDDVIYNVAGQRLERTQRGINIVHGKKKIIK